MIRLLWAASAQVRYFLQRYMPSNIILDLLRTRQGLKWGVPAMLLAIPYLAIAHWCTTLIGGGAPGWLHLVVLVCIWNALKMMLFGPVSLVMLGRRALANADHGASAKHGVRRCNPNWFTASSDGRARGPLQGPLLLGGGAASLHRRMPRAQRRFFDRVLAIRETHEVGSVGHQRRHAGLQQSVRSRTRDVRYRSGDRPNSSPQFRGAMGHGQ